MNNLEGSRRIRPLKAYFEASKEGFEEKHEGAPLLYIDPDPPRKDNKTIRIRRPRSDHFATVVPTIEGYGVFAVPLNEKWDPSKKNKKEIELLVIHPAVIYGMDKKGKLGFSTLKPGSHIMAHENDFTVWKSGELPPKRHRATR